jgi:hypothetical protein
MNVHTADFEPPGFDLFNAVFQTTRLPDSARFPYAAIVTIRKI